MSDLLSPTSVTPVLLEFLVKKDPLAALRLSEKCFDAFPSDLRLCLPAAVAWLDFEETVVQSAST